MSEHWPSPREIGDPVRQADARNGLGEVLFQLDDATKAREHHAAALRLAAEPNSLREQARAHRGLARVCEADGDPAQARYHWRQALTRYVALGALEAREIRARLSDTTTAAPR